MMRKRILAVMIFVLMLAAFPLMACDDDHSPATPLTPVADIPDSATVEVGDAFDFETAAVAKGDKVYLPKSVTITFGENENVEFTGTKFVPAKVGNYTILFTFDIDGETKTYTSTVTAQDTKKPSIIMTGELPVRVEKGDEITLPAFSALDICDGELKADVKVYQNNAEKMPVTVTENKFTVNTYDGVIIEASAVDAANNAVTESYTVIARKEREIDYFDNEPYTLASMKTHGGGKTGFNTDPSFVIQGTGSAEFYTDKWGRWVYCFFDSVNEAIKLAGGAGAFKDEYSDISFLLYNASPYDCPLMFANWEFNAANNPVDDTRTVVKEFTVLKDVWTKITLSTADLMKNYTENRSCGLYFNGDHAPGGAFEDFRVYVDCMRLAKTGDPTANITVNNITKKINKSAKVDVDLLTLSSLTGIDASSLNVTAFGADSSAATVEKTQTAYVLKNVGAGDYTVQYMYVDGENIDVFSQVVKLYEPLDDPYFDGFEGGGYAHTLTPKGTGAAYVSEDIAHSGTHSLKIENGEWSTYTFVPLMLDADMIKVLQANSQAELSVWLYIDNSNTNLTSFNVRFAAYDPDPAKDHIGQYTDGGYSGSPNGNNVPTGKWLEVKFGNKYNNGIINKIVQDGGITLYLQLGVANEGIGRTFTYYIDDLTVTTVDSAVKMTFTDIEQPYTENMTVDLADLSTTDKFAGITDRSKLFITCDGVSADYKIDGNVIKFNPAGPGTYKFEYKYVNGHNVNSATQSVTLYNPLPDANIEDFEHDVRFHIEFTDNQPSSAGISSDVSYGGNGHSYKVVNPRDNAYTYMKFTLPEEMIAKITDNSTLSLRVYIASKGAAVGLHGRAYADTDMGNAVNGRWFNNLEDVALNTWHEITCTGEALKQVKAKKAFWFHVQVGGDNADHTCTYYIDNIEITDPETNVTITAEDKNVPFAGGGTSIEIATFAGEHFDPAKLSVTMNGTLYTGDTLTNGKLLFAPSQVGVYTFVYTYINNDTNKHFIKKVEQTVNVYNPLIEGFEKGTEAYANYVEVRKGDQRNSRAEVTEQRKFEGRYSLKIVQEGWTFFVLDLGDALKQQITTNSKLKMRVFVESGSGDFGVRAYQTPNGGWDSCAAGWLADATAMSTSTTKWHEFITVNPLSSVAENGKIVVFFNNGVDATFYIDNIEVVNE